MHAVRRTTSPSFDKDETNGLTANLKRAAINSRIILIANGIGPGDCVAGDLLHIEAPSLVWALLGIFKAGAAFVVLESGASGIADRSDFPGSRRSTRVSCRSRRLDLYLTNSGSSWAICHVLLFPPLTRHGKSPRGCLSSSDTGPAASICKRRACSLRFSRKIKYVRNTGCAGSEHNKRSASLEVVTPKQARALRCA